MNTDQKMSACLWFDKNAQEAVDFYLSVFKNSRVIRTSHYGKEGYEQHGMPEGTVLTIDFELNGYRFMALNAGPAFTFTEAVSFYIECNTQEEIDHYWDKLKEGGDEKAQVCGWLKDKYGLSWQVAPAFMAEILAGGVTEGTERAMKAMMQMKKMDLQKLKDAYEGVK